MRLLFMLCLVGAIVGVARAQARDDLKRSVPVDAIEGILGAFASHDIVALGEGNHGNVPGHEFRIALIRHPKFSAVVNDIVVEFGNSMYQSLIDRYVNGDTVPDRVLRQVWQNTTQAHAIWDRPIYADFFRAVREVNRALPKGKRLRVVLGDPPIDWAKVASGADYARQLEAFGGRDEHAASLIRREVIAKRRKALLIYGDGHFQRKNVYFQLENRDLAEQKYRDVDTIVAKLEGAGPIKLYSIWTYTYGDPTAFEPDIATMRVPALIPLAGTSWARAPFTSFLPPAVGMIGYRTPNGEFKRERLIPDPERSPRMQEQFDAILYLGLPATLTYSKLTRELCDDPAYIKMRSARLRVLAPQSQGHPAPDPTAGLKRECRLALSDDESASSH